MITVLAILYGAGIVIAFFAVQAIRAEWSPRWWIFALSVAAFWPLALLIAIVLILVFIALDRGGLLR